MRILVNDDSTANLLRSLLTDIQETGLSLLRCCGGQDLSCSLDELRMQIPELVAATEIEIGGPMVSGTKEELDLFSRFHCDMKQMGWSLMEEADLQRVGGLLIMPHSDRASARRLLERLPVREES